MPRPTAATLQTHSQVDFAGLGFADAGLTRLVELSIARLRALTGQFWTPTIDPVVHTYSDIAPAEGTEAIAEDIVQTLTEWEAFRKQEDRAETMGDWDLLSSFSAGSYSESRRSGKDAMEAQDAMVKSLLWPVMSEGKRDEWRERMGVVTPAFEVSENDWSNTSAAFGRGSALGGDGAWW